VLQSSKMENNFCMGEGVVTKIGNVGITGGSPAF